VLRGVKIIFVDIRPDTMNIEAAIAKKYKLFVVEDAAQGMMSTYKGKPLGSIGDFGTYSFHETKNYTSAGEGGLLIINNE
jgi:dTDP-4-amino-4,6-dideoxygalactose transaminase